MSDLATFAGKYGAYIWPAYGASLLAFAWMIADTLRRARRWRREVERLEKGASGENGDVSLPPSGEVPAKPGMGAPVSTDG